MKKSVVLILSMCMLAGCSSVDTVPDTSASTAVTTTAASSTTEVSETTVPSETTEETTEETVLQLPANEFTNDIPLVSIDRIDPNVNEEMITIEGEGFEVLSDSIDELQSSNRETYDELCDPESSSSDRYYLERCDSELVSFYYSSHYSLDDALYAGYTYTCDGDIVYFEDLIIPGQRAAFTDAVEDFIRTEYRYALQHELSEVLDIEDVYSQFEDMDNTQWFLDVSSIVFIYRYHFGNSQKDRACAIHIPYDQFEEYLNPEFLPGDKAMIGTYSNFDFCYSEDCMLHTTLRHNRLRDYIVNRNFDSLYVNDNEYGYDNAFLDDTGVCTYVRDENGNSYLAIVQNPTYEPVEGEKYVKVYDITEGELDLVYSSDEYENRHFSNIPEVLALVEEGTP